MTPKRNKVALNAYIDRAVAERLERYVSSRELPPSKTAMIELALTRLLDELDGKKAPAHRATKKPRTARAA